MKNKNTFFITGAIGLLGFFPLIAWSQTLPLVTAKQAGGGTLYSVPVETLLAITALSFLPAALVLMTSFTRILIVFSLLRQALGLTTMPPNIDKNAYQPYSIGKMGFPQAVEVGAKPLKEFMLKQTRKDDLNLFVKMYGKEIQAREDVPFTVLIPAFAISEIKTGFLIGFVIFLPFLVIDFAVASILTSLGMVMVSPMMFSLPIKLIVFTLADGWALLSTSVVQSYIN